MKKYIGTAGIQSLLQFLKSVIDSFSETIEAITRAGFSVSYDVNPQITSPLLPAGASYQLSGVADLEKVKIGDTIRLTRYNGTHGEGFSDATVITVSAAHLAGDNAGFMFMAVDAELQVWRVYRNGTVWGVSCEKIGDDPDASPYRPACLDFTPSLEELLEYPLGTTFPFQDPLTGEEDTLTLRSWQVIEQQGWCASKSALAAVCTDTRLRAYMLFYNEGDIVAYSSLATPFDITASDNSQLVN